MSARARRAIASLAATFALLASERPCHAIDGLPFDWVALPARTDVLMVYYGVATRSEYNSTLTGTVDRDTRLDSQTGILRYIHYGDIFGQRFALTMVVPFVALTGGEIGGQRLGHAVGVSDPLASLGAWVINRPEHRQYLSAANFVTIPLGAYESQRPLNPGGHRWQNDLQVDFTQGLPGPLTFDVSADWAAYDKNTDYGPAHGTLTQRSTFGVYTWLSCDISSLEHQRTGAAAISLGYYGTFGGAQRLDGELTGAKTGEHQLRVNYLQFITQWFQGSLQVSRDVAVSGQFKQDFNLQLRVAFVL